MPIVRYRTTLHCKRKNQSKIDFRIIFRKRVAKPQTARKHAVQRQGMARKTFSSKTDWLDGTARTNVPCWTREIHKFKTIRACLTNRAEMYANDRIPETGERFPAALVSVPRNRNKFKIVLIRKKYCSNSVPRRDRYDRSRGQY